MFNIFKSKKEKTIEKLTQNWRSYLQLLQKYDAHKAFEACIKSELHMQKSVHNIYSPDFSVLYDNAFTTKDSYDLWLVRFSGILLQALILRGCITSKIEHYLSVLLRKREMLITKDDYGDYDFNKWFKELHHFYKTKLTNDIYEWCKKNPDLTKLDPYFDLSYYTNDPDMCMTYIVDSYLDAYDYEPQEEYAEDMSGLEYEQFICGLFQDEGFDSIVTKATGDHGVDVISEYESFKIAIQCKHYNSKVSNKAVQEIYTAKNIFDCNIAIVVTNNEFTPAAKEAAKKLAVYLLHHDDISSFCNEIKTIVLNER